MNRRQFCLRCGDSWAMDATGLHACGRWNAEKVRALFDSYSSGFTCDTHDYNGLADAVARALAAVASAPAEPGDAGGACP